ncbi:high affinity copper uptake protein 1-like [Paramacrobiotus metropolitanus]|uniref:high affinity copper uptake protein 1-like n=1 Tax=Paramacrobiotus metropolitanus TaxID=2943436 RepID=UPI0024456F32|nr:high affinity copper uptake protein 1-like [Paramacrobiotus metropolitanus]
MEVDSDLNQTDHHHHDHAAASHGHGGMSHGMFFHTRTTETILFEAWNVQRTEQLVGSCLVIFLLAVFFEGIKYLRNCLLRKATLRRGMLRADDGPATTAEVRVVGGKNGFLQRTCNRDHFAQTLLYVLQFIVGYLLMLVFMTYNVWLCLAVVAGIGTGYFLFGQERLLPDAVGTDAQNGDCACH